MATSDTSGVEGTASAQAQAADYNKGLLAATSAYTIWGLFPLLFRQLDAVEPITVVANRIVWSVIFIAILLVALGRAKETIEAMQSWRTIKGLFVSAAFLSVNWLVFVWAVNNGQVLEASFGYFITPLVSVALGTLFLRERLNRLQMLSVSIAVIAVAILAVGVGGLPLVSLTLAFTFGLYGYIRKKVTVGAVPGLFIETLLLLPFALGYLIYATNVHGGAIYADPRLLTFLVLTGPATSITLILFAFGARRLELKLIGMLQYIAPSMHLLLAIFLFNEHLGIAQIWSFAVIWVSLAIYSYDSFQNRNKKLV